MADNLICPHCGQVHRSGAKFCPSTGKILQATAPPAPVPASPPPPSGGLGPPPSPAPPAPLATGGAIPGAATGRLPANMILHQRYLIINKVGQGGMAAVYRVADTLYPGKVWAVKEMSAAALSPDELNAAVKSFHQEANLLMQLDHPNLPKVVDSFTEGGKHYLVMEFVEGQSLEARISASVQPVPEHEVMQWAVQLCDVLSYLHGQNIIFRDLKPSNIMLTPSGQVKLIDFGIVRFFKPGKTRDTQALGTPGYCAPEATTGQTDQRSDLYSLCITLHQLLTLHDPSSTMFNQPPIRKVNPSVSIALERALMKGMHNQRDLRWNTVAELQAEIYHILGVPIPKPVPGQGVYPSRTPGTISPGSAPMTVVAPRPSQQNYPPPPNVGFAPMAAPPSASTARPTTRLLMAAAQLSPRQFALIIAGVIVFLIVATALLAPVLDEMDFNWNKVPIIAIFGALGYAAYPKRGSAFLAHSVLTLVMTLTILIVLGDQGYEFTELILAVLVSGAFMEVWVYFLPKIKGGAGNDAWGREAAWLAAMAMGGTALFFMILFDLQTGLDPIKLLLSAIFGLIGWFVGDFVQQYMLFRKTGLRRRP